MAINSKKYVDISTTFPSTGTGERALGGLVFTATDMLASAPSNIKNKYDAGGVVGISLDDVRDSFGIDSNEYKFAQGYYYYISPSGRYASQLKFYKVTESTLLESFKAANNKTNMFGSFTFLPPSADGSSADGNEATWDIDAYRDVALANAEYDTKYLFVINVTPQDYPETDALETVVAQFKDIRGTLFQYGSSVVSGYMPMAILGSTDYTNGQVVNFMFKTFSTEVPSVESDYLYEFFNHLCVNFYGYTQTNGQTLAFYQRGFNTDGQDTAIYCNELWFKAACETALLDLMTSRERLPANALGIDLVKLEIAQIGSIATSNGTFMQKEADVNDLRQIREIVIGSDGAETDVDGIVSDIANTGYSTYAFLSQLNNQSITGPQAEKIIAYYVFYGSADSIRFIKGYNVLI